MFNNFSAEWGGAFEIVYYKIASIFTPPA